LIAIVALVLTIAGPAHATTPGTNGKIAFVDGGDIWVMNPDGTAKTQLTSAPESDSEPDWSPDGTRIAFDRCDPVGPCRSPGSAHSVYVMDADGSNQHLVVAGTTHFWGTGPSWSPDGTRIAYVSGAAPRIWTVNADGSNPADLPISGSVLDEESIPLWSPDGLEIAFTACIDCEALLYGIAVVPAGGGAWRAVGPFGIGLDWSPDSAYLLQSAFGDYMYRIRRDGTDQQLISFGPQLASWSPDGSKIAVDDPLATDQVIVMNADGSSPTPLGTGADPDWQSLPVSVAKNHSKACKDERERLGEAAFAAKYGGAASAHGKCVSQKP
jgi:Tol biopolymer transport system component